MSERRISKLEEEREDWYKKLIREDKERQRKERWKKIKSSEYKWYGRIKEEGIPEYLKKG